MRQIRNLKFLGHPMHNLDGVFWYHSPRTDFRVKDISAKPGTFSYFVCSLHGVRIKTENASGTIAARNKAERWFRKWAADVGEIAKGKV